MADRKKKILVVEDSEALSLSLKVAFQGTGYDVDMASDGAEALFKASSVMPDLILLDLFIPEVDGFKVLEHLKSDRRTGDIPVIIFSVLSQQADKDEAVRLGAVAYFVKSEMSLADVVEGVKKFL